MSYEARAAPAGPFETSLSWTWWAGSTSSSPRTPRSWGTCAFCMARVVDGPVDDLVRIAAACSPYEATRVPSVGGPIAYGTLVAPYGVMTLAFSARVAH